MAVQLQAVDIRRVVPVAIDRHRRGRPSGQMTAMRRVYGRHPVQIQPLVRHVLQVHRVGRPIVRDGGERQRAAGRNEPLDLLVEAGG